MNFQKLPDHLLQEIYSEIHVIYHVEAEYHPGSDDWYFPSDPYATGELKLLIPFFGNPQTVVPTEKIIYQLLSHWVKYHNHRELKQQLEEPIHWSSLRRYFTDFKIRNLMTNQVMNVDEIDSDTVYDINFYWIK